MIYGPLFTRYICLFLPLELFFVRAKFTLFLNICFFNNKIYLIKNWKNKFIRTWWVLVNIRNCMNLKGTLFFISQINIWVLKIFSFFNKSNYHSKAQGATVPPKVQESKTHQKYKHTTTNLKDTSICIYADIWRWFNG